MIKYFRVFVTRLLLKLIDTERFFDYLNRKDIISKSNSIAFTGSPVDFIIGSNSVVYKEAKIINVGNRVNNLIIGENTHIRGHIQIIRDGGEVSIGDHCYIGEDTRIWASEKITIGNRVLISHNVNIHDNITHPLNAQERHQDFLRIINSGTVKDQNFDLRSKSIIIGNDVWIGFNSTILKGVKIGNGSIVGAGSFVTKDVPDSVVVVGNPAKILKSLEE